MSYTDDRIFLIECMVKAGYTQNSARKWLNSFVDRANKRALEDSDHSAYRELADAVNELLAKTTEDQDRWDGDDSELSILMDFLEWLPDMILHQAADKIRNEGVECRLKTHRTYFADLIDPFSQVPDGQGELCWLRKRDGAPVPERVVWPEEANDVTP